MIDQHEAELIGEEEACYEMANLFPKHTGLPFVVWVSIRGRARHDVRVRVSLGSKVQPDDFISVGIRPAVHVIDGDGGMRRLIRLIWRRRFVLCGSGEVAGAFSLSSGSRR
jgi:hypothetical protein